MDFDSYRAAKVIRYAHFVYKLTYSSLDRSRISFLSKSPYIELGSLGLSICLETRLFYRFSPLSQFETIFQHCAN